MSKTIVVTAAAAVVVMLLFINITGYIMDHFNGKHNHTLYGLIDLNDSGNFTNTTGEMETIHLSDIQEDQIVIESGDDLRK